MVPPSLSPDGEIEGAIPAPPAIGSRIGVYAAFGASADALPLPWVPGALARRIRGALVHDIATRHGVSLTPAARSVLAEPLAPGAHRGVVAEAARFVGAKVAMKALARIGPVGVLWPIGGAVRTYVLGRLFERYLTQRRRAQAVRIDEEEAKRVRAAIDGAVARAWSRDVAPAPEAAAIDDQRDVITALLDGVLGAAARVPEKLGRRLDAAFDEGIADAAR